MRLSPARLLALALILVGSSLLSAGCSLDGRASSFGEGELAGTELEVPVPKPSFTLTRVDDGTAFDFTEETRGHLTLLFLGYTHCPDVCPVHMANLAAVLRDLPREVEREIRVVFVSTDPERDTPERIRTWLSGFHPSFIGLRGTRRQVRALEEKLAIAPSVLGDADSTGDDYFVGHAAQVLAFEKDDTARVAYPWGTRQRDWLRDLPILVGDERIDDERRGAMR